MNFFKQINKHSNRIFLFARSRTDSVCRRGTIYKDIVFRLQAYTLVGILRLPKNAVGAVAAEAVCRRTCFEIWVVGLCSGALARVRNIAVVFYVYLFSFFFPLISRKGS